MMPIHISLQDPRQIAALASGVVAVAGLVGYIIWRRRPSPDEIERRRREFLLRHGRIIDGAVVDVPVYSSTETAPEDERCIVVYQYRIAGVRYECAQDVTKLVGQVKSFRMDLPVSVRYDTRNPGNSIVLAEGWSGLHGGLRPAQALDRRAQHAS
jgi:hypothetical protein